MHKNIGTVILLNKSKTFGFVEPFYFAKRRVWHKTYLVLLTCFLHLEWITDDSSELDAMELTLLPEGKIVTTPIIIIRPPSSTAFTANFHEFFFKLWRYQTKAQWHPRCLYVPKSSCRNTAITRIKRAKVKMVWRTPPIRALKQSRSVTKCVFDATQSLFLPTYKAEQSVIHAQRDLSVSNAPNTLRYQIPLN